MEVSVRRILQMSLVMLLTVSVWSGVDVTSAQDTASDLDTAEASGFIGDWVLAMNSPEGPFNLGLSIKDVEGKVAAELKSEVQGARTITDISKSGDGLVLQYESDFKGKTFPVVLTLNPDGDTLRVVWNSASGQFVIDGTGKK